VLGGLLALLVEVFKVDTLLLLLFRWSRLVGGILGIVGDGNGSIGKDVSREENDIGTDLSEFRRGDYQAGNGSERLDRSLRVLGELFSSCGYRSGVDVNVDVGVGSVVLDYQLWSNALGTWTHEEVLQEIITVLLVSPSLGSLEDVLYIVEDPGSFVTKSRSSGVGSAGRLEGVGIDHELEQLGKLGLRSGRQ
jgi:hypothetical protein